MFGIRFGKKKKKSEPESPVLDIARDFVAIEKPLPDKATHAAILEMLGRIEHELVLYRRERLLKTYALIILVILPLLGLGFLIPEFIRSYAGK